MTGTSPGRHHRFSATTARDISDAEAPVIAAQAALLREAAAARGLTAYRLAKASGIALSTTQNAVRGTRLLPASRSHAEGSFATRASAHVYAELALQLGLSPDAVADVGRPDAAELMEQALAAKDAAAGRKKQLADTSNLDLVATITTAVAELQRRAKKA